MATPQRAEQHSPAGVLLTSMTRVRSAAMSPRLKQHDMSEHPVLMRAMAPTSCLACAP